MSESDDDRITNREVYNTLLEFKKEFGDYVKEQGPKMALLEYKVLELEKKQQAAETQALTDKAAMEAQAFTERQNRKLYLWAFGGSSVALEIVNWIVFHK